MGLIFVLNFFFSKNEKDSDDVPPDSDTQGRITTCQDGGCAGWRYRLHTENTNDTVTDS